jgi:hypothetical protein
MDTTKVRELVKAFEQLTPEERQFALSQILPAAGVQQTAAGPAAWGEQAAALIESLDLGDYSGVGDSVEWLKQQREVQNARRLGQQGRDE